MPPVVSDKAPDFVKNVLAKIISGDGDQLPVSAMPNDGTFQQLPHNGRNGTLLLKFLSGKWKFVFSAINVHWYVRTQQSVRKYLILQNSHRLLQTSSRWITKDRSTRVEIHRTGSTGRLYRMYFVREVCPAKSKKEAKVKAINMNPSRNSRTGKREF